MMSNTDYLFAIINYMAEPKTKLNTSNVLDFVSTVPGEQKQEDSLQLINIFKSATGQQPQMWGTSIIGFGMYQYKAANSSQEVSWPLVAFSPRKQNLTLYIIDDSTDYMSLLSKLGKYKASKACLYINKLSDVDITVLKQLIKKSYAAMKKKHLQN